MNFIIDIPAVLNFIFRHINIDQQRIFIIDIYFKKENNNEKTSRKKQKKITNQQVHQQHQCHTIQPNYSRQFVWFAFYPHIQR